MPDKNAQHTKNTRGFLNMTKSIFEKPIINIIFNGKVSKLRFIKYDTKNMFHKRPTKFINLKSSTL